MDFNNSEDRIRYYAGQLMAALVKNGEFDQDYIGFASSAADAAIKLEHALESALTNGDHIDDCEVAAG